MNSSGHLFSSEKNVEIRVFMITSVFMVIGSGLQFILDAIGIRPIHKSDHDRMSCSYPTRSCCLVNNGFCWIQKPERITIAAVEETERVVEERQKDQVRPCAEVPTLGTNTLHP